MKRAGFFLLQISPSHSLVCKNVPRNRNERLRGRAKEREESCYNMFALHTQLVLADERMGGIPFRRNAFPFSFCIWFCLLVFVWF